MRVPPGGGGAASVAELRSYANYELFTLWGYRSWETHSGNEDGEVGAQLQIYANVKEGGMVII
jgi:hypothetical protein